MGVTSSEITTTPYDCPFCGAKVVIESEKDVRCPTCGKILWFVKQRVAGVIVITFLPGLMTASESIQNVDDLLSAVGRSTRIVLNLSLASISRNMDILSSHP